MYAAHLRSYQGEPVDETAELENDRVSLRTDDLAVDRAASFLRTRPPVGEEGDQSVLPSPSVSLASFSFSTEGSS